LEVGNIQYQMRQCKNEVCRFRYPAAAGVGVVCPKCRSETDSFSLPERNPQETAVSAKNSVYLEILLDNLRSLYNVGAIFRTADGAGVQQLHLGGITATPHNPKLAKTALGAVKHIPWQYHLNGLDTAVALQKQGYRLWALEDTPMAEPLFESELVPDGRPVLLIIGNENIGIDPAILEICEKTLALPMLGVKDSLNVSVAFGIALYHLIFGRRHDNHPPQ